MQSWGLGNVPPVATGKFIEDTKVRQVSPVSTIPSTEGSDDGRISLKERRFALEQEIAKLRKKFSQEEKLRETLKRALQRPVGSLPRITPSLKLPAKIQKLLLEVAVLEEEVIKLEDQVGYLRREISDETSQVVSHVSQKQRPVSDQHFNKPSYLSGIRVPKESSSKELVSNSSKAPPTKEPLKTSRKTSKASNEPPHQQRSQGKDRAVSKSSKLGVAVAPPSGHTTFVSDDSRRGAGPSKGAPLSGPPPSRKPPGASDVVGRLEGWQQQTKSGGVSGRNNPYKQFNSLNVGQSSHSAIQRNSSGISSPRNSPRGSFNSTSALSLNLGEKYGNSSTARTSATSSPRSSPRTGQSVSVASNVGSIEKENQHSAASRLVSRNPGASRFGLSVDLSSSNVERKSRWGISKGSSALPPSGKLSFSVISEGPMHGLGPNRLAEELVRCLVAIYSKLTRFSPGSGGRGSQNLRSQGFGSRGKHTSEPLRDVYGMGKDTPMVDIGPYRLAQETTAIDYTKMDSTGAGNPAANWRKMRSLLDQLEKATLDALSHHEKLAFWINMYNVCMMHAYLEHGIPDTPKKVVDLMRKAVVNVGGFVVDALTIEHICRLPPRPRSARTAPRKNFQRGETQQAMTFLKSVGMDEILERSAFGLDRNEPMVTFALCCGTRSSPALRVYTSSGIESELDTARREYLQAAVAVSNQRKIYLPELLECYMRDFARDMEGLLDWLCQQLSGPLRAAVADCVNHPREGVLSHSINVMLYDYNFRYLFLAR